MSHLNLFYGYCTLLYLAFLIGIIVLANLGMASWVFTFARLFPMGDKFCHLILMGILSYLVNSALYCKTISLKGVKILSGSLWISLLVIAEEISQIFVSSRNADIGDGLSDICGIVLFGILARKNLSFKHQTDRKLL